MTYLHKTLLVILSCFLFLACGTKQTIDSKKQTEVLPVQASEVKQLSAGEKSNSEELGSIGHPISFYFTPSVSQSVVREKAQKLIDFLESETKLKFVVQVPDDYEEMIQAFGSEDAHVALMNSLSYVKAHAAFGVSAKLRAVRYRKSTYFGQIIANAKKGISSLKDLQGKTIAYTDSSSASGYLYPKNILLNAGIEPSKTVFAGSHDTVVKMVYSGVADAGATFYSEPDADGTIRDARSRVLDRYPDVEEKVKIIEITEPIPNDPVVFAKSISKALSYKISLAMIKFVSSQEGKETLESLYSIEGFVRCTDADYEVLRNVLN